jgi:hypothetical protein
VRFGEADYRQGAFERLQESRALLDKELFAGSIYLAGRAVEGMLRAIIWRNDREIRLGRKSLETGHDLRQLLTRVGNLGLLPPKGQDEVFNRQIQHIARLWLNDMRFASAKIIAARWRDSGYVMRNRTFKKAAAEYFQDCSAIIRRCEVLCQS